VSEDPIGLRGGINNFGYVGNNSSNLVDPRGTDGCRRLPNGNCVAERQAPIVGGEPDRGGPKMFGDPPRSTTPSTSQTSTPSSGTSTGSAGCDCTSNPYQNSFPGTLQLGLGGSGVLGFIPLAGSGGIAIDTSGNIGLYGEYGSGVGIGADATAGVQIQATSGRSTNSLRGIFVNPSGGLGEGLAGTAGGVFGLEDDYTPIIGGSVLLGAGAGADVAVTVTNTHVPNSTQFNIWKALGYGCKK
jgi:hypothetical protein